METFQSERGDDYRVWSLDLMVTTHVTARLLVGGESTAGYYHINGTEQMASREYWSITPPHQHHTQISLHRPDTQFHPYIYILRLEVVWCYIFVVWLRVYLASQMLSQMISGHVLWPSPSHSTMFVQPSPSTLSSSRDGDYCQEFNTNWGQTALR